VLAFIKSEGGDVECARKAGEASRAGTGTRPVVLKLPFSAVVKAALFTDDRYAVVPRERIDLQDVREKLSQVREPPPPEPATA
jgi:hypothetical protein